MPESARTPVLDIAYEAHGLRGGTPVFLMHGFPDDARAYDGCIADLVDAGCWVVVPYMRGYGGTQYRSPATLRSGEQAAFGADLRDLMDALGVEKAILGGYDWGGRAACAVSALWPERVIGLVSINGYNIQDIAASGRPADPEQELRHWYQWYFNTERGRAGLAANRHALCRLLWKLWSPNWQFSEAKYAATAISFDNPDFVETVIHSYRHRHRNAEGDPAYAPIEALLARQPTISVPTIVLHGEADGVGPVAGSANDARHFSGRYERRVIPVAGHFLPHEAPGEMVRAVRDLLG